MEACESSHYWRQKFAKLGHAVLLLPARIVKPFVQGNTKLTIYDTLAIVKPFWTSYGVGENRTAEGSTGTARVTVVIDQKTYPVDEHAKNPAAGIG